MNLPDASRGRVPRQAILVSTLVMLAVAIGAFVMGWKSSRVPRLDNGYAEHIVLQDEACSEIQSARMVDGSKPPAQAMPCVFTGYAYATKVPGLLDVEGISDNIKGQCITLSAATIDLQRSYTDTDYPQQPDMPASVLAKCLPGIR